LGIFCRWTFIWVQFRLRLGTLGSTLCFTVCSTCRLYQFFAELADRDESIKSVKLAGKDPMSWPPWSKYRPWWSN
jgi:hypothetical protein